MPTQVQVKRATLFDPTGKRTPVAVEVGSQKARDLFGQGFQLQPSQPGPSKFVQNESLQNANTNPMVNPSQTQTDPYTTFQSAISGLLKKAQGSTFGGDQDLETQRNELIRARFGARTDITPENLRVLTPAQQAALRGSSTQGLEEQLSGVTSAITARRGERKESLDAFKTFQEGIDKERDRQLKDLEEQRKLVLGGYKKLGPSELKKYSEDQIVRLPGTRDIYLKPPEKEKDLPVSYREYQLAKQEGFKGSYNDYQTMDANRKAVRTSTTNIINPVTGYTPAQVKAIGTINNSIANNATYKKTASMKTFAENVIGALSQVNGTADIAAINQFQKVIDEGAVTRDQDVKLIQASQSLSNQLQTLIARLGRGEQLSPTQRSQMKNLVEKMYNTQIKALQKDPFVASKLKEADLNQIKKEDTILSELQGFEISSATQQETRVVNGKTYKKVQGGWQLTQ